MSLPLDAARALVACALLSPVALAATPTVETDRQAVAALDTAYQEAVKRNDAEAMARILHDDFILVLGDGRTCTRDDLLESARDRHFEFERQEEDPGTQVVRIYGDTAIVTARLWLRYSADGRQHDRRVWFSDTYVRTPAGWKYAFGQASLSLPPDAPR